MTARGIWARLEREMAVGDCWQFDDGELCTVARLTHNGIEPAIICTSGISYPIAAVVRTADKVSVQARRAA